MDDGRGLAVDDGPPKAPASDGSDAGAPVGTHPRMSWTLPSELSLVVSRGQSIDSRHWCQAHPNPRGTVRYRTYTLPKGASDGYPVTRPVAVLRMTTWSHAVGVLVAACLLTLPAFPANASNSPWNTSNNTNAEPALIQTYSILYPLAGDAPVGQFSATVNPADDFCFGTRPYTVSACDRENAHSGNDLYAQPAVNDGVIRVIAAIGGTVLRADCQVGAGHRVLIQAADGRYYHYLHMANGSLNVAAGTTISTGTKLGNMGSTDGCPDVRGAGQHLHFNISTSESTLHSRSPYPSLRTTFAKPGHDTAIDTTADPSFADAYHRAMNSYGGYPAALGTVGWPNGYLSGSDRSPAGRAPGSSQYSSGFYQWLSNGNQSYDSQGLSRIGMLGRAGSSTSAWRVSGLVWLRYTSLNVFKSFLGFPTSGEFVAADGLKRQDFQGGCIKNDGGGYADGRNPYQAAAYGTGVCR